MHLSRAVAEHFVAHNARGDAHVMRDGADFIGRRVSGIVGAGLRPALARGLPRRRRSR